MSPRVLIIDDDEDLCALITQLLEREFEVHCAYDGMSGLEALKQFAPDAVLLDVIMSGMDGFEVCRRIKEQPESELTQVMLLSANGETEFRLRGYACGADDFFVKPFDHAELVAKVRLLFRLRNSLMELASTRAKLAIHNMRLEELVLRRTADIVATRDITVFALAKLAESRDSDTGDHLERMRGYAQTIARQMAISGPYAGLVDKSFLEDLYRSSPLHDIGKVGIPDAILRKPDRLTTAEFELMKQHTVLGEETLRSASMHTQSGGFLMMGAEIARSHHERFDGNGYPDGLAGNDIPLSARIVAVADVFDALTSARCYKSAMLPDVARSMIVEESGAHFDPEIVAAFEASWPLLTKQGESRVESFRSRPLISSVNA